MCARLLICMLVACTYAPHTASSSDDAPLAIDAASDDAADASPDSPFDAPAFTCNVIGVQCPGGQPLRKLACGDPNDCWVGCRDGDVVSPAGAEAFCTNLGMHLGAFDAPADETCVRTVLDGAIILGITQLPAQANPDDGWVRTANTQPAQHFNWDNGQPEDAPTTGEQGEQQCAFSNASGKWNDIACAVDVSARWICRRP
jgi:hypothetical protein